MPESDLDWLTERRPAGEAPSPQCTARARDELLAHGVRRRRTRRRAHAALAAGVSAAAAAIVLATDGIGIGGGTGAPGQGSRPPAPVASTPPGITVHTGPTSRPAPLADTPLTQLASDVRVIRHHRIPDNATLIVRDTYVDGVHEVDGAVYGGYDLYTDAGRYYYAAYSLADLQQTVDAHQPVLEGGDAAVTLTALARHAGQGPQRVRAALLATQPRGGRPIPFKRLRHMLLKQFSSLPEPRRSQYDRKYVPDRPPTPAAVRADVDATVWSTATLALEIGFDRPRVRAGAMEAIATVPGVKEIQTRIHGIPALELRYGPQQERLWLDDRTGVPIEEKDGAASQTAFIVERVDTRHLPHGVTSAHQLR